MPAHPVTALVQSNSAPLSELVSLVPKGQRLGSAPKQPSISPSTGVPPQAPRRATEVSENVCVSPVVTLEPLPAQNHSPALGPSSGILNTPMAGELDPGISRSLSPKRATCPWV